MIFKKSKSDSLKFEYKPVTKDLYFDFDKKQFITENKVWIHRTPLVTDSAESFVLMSYLQPEKL